MILLVFFIFGFPLALLLAIHSGFKKSSRAQLEAGERQREAVLYTTELGRQQLAIEQAERKRNQRNEVIGKLIATAAIVIGLFIWSTNRVTEHQSAIATPIVDSSPVPTPTVDLPPIVTPTPEATAEVRRALPVHKHKH